MAMVGEDRLDAEGPGRRLGEQHHAQQQLLSSQAAGLGESLCLTLRF